LHGFQFQITEQVQVRRIENGGWLEGVHIYERITPTTQTRVLCEERFEKRVYSSLELGERILVILVWGL
jgi:hypothetical protein